jgi:hypothetical protein
MEDMVGYELKGYRHFRREAHGSNLPFRVLDDNDDDDNDGR